ncbi:uncharacterized protein LOC132838386 isoform X1 [Tachysurus vachellii]|uniref:uncharacterized protein LOC132838374 isoform X1 n=2 Tax=Tachysurus vachellii TaxID=175792 RepID=UPI00296B0891|nr:uncharacterized protein LOC132838374 isoform X1 [Tachysurus vachellii]XP_060714662.1 uncharacterized protein LOC132838386 isoform X1 [Tachysurus vachellii]
MAQRERTYINEEQRETLKSFFKEGMTRVGSPIIIRAASTTGLDTSVIENWIGNYKRSLNASSEPRPLKAKVHIRELSPYNLFCRDILKNKGTMKDMGRWSTLGKEDKDKYCQEAAALRAHGQAQDLSPEMRDHQIKMHLKKLKLEVSKLEDLSVETAVLSFDRQKSSLEVYELSSKGAADFLHSTDTVNNFALHFKASSSAATSSTRVEVNVLLRKVQDLFNQKYKEAGGTGRLPYQSLVNQGMTIKVAGLPNSLTFKKPSYYGRNQLEAILQAAEEISFEINAAQCNTTDTAEGMSEAMDAEDTADVVQTQSAEEILEAMCENGTELEKQSSETATTVAIVMTADEDGGNLCCVCHIHFDDRKKNASKKWRSWAQCANHGHTLHVVLKKTCVLNASVKTPCKHPEALHQ